MITGFGRAIRNGQRIFPRSKMGVIGKMRIALINSSYGSGSTGKICKGIHDIGTRNGLDVHTFYSGFKPNALPDSTVINTKTEIRFHRLFSLLTGKQGLFSVASTKKLIQQIISYQPDVIHLHNLHGFYLNYKILFRFLKGYHKPVIWTLHDCWAFTGHCTHFTLASCNQYRTECNKCPIYRQYPYGLIDRANMHFHLKQKLYSTTNIQFTAVSKWLSQIAMSSALLKNHKIDVIPNGINLEVFQPRERIVSYGPHHFENKKIILGVANEWSARKGLREFLRLSELLPDNYVILLIGVDNKTASGLPHNIYPIKKTTNQEELASFYSTADFFFNPSMEETFGLTIIEAMACGTPVIVYRSTACPELVDDHQRIEISQWFSKAMLYILI